MYILYQSQPSGNCYKVRLLLTQLNLPFTTIEVNIFKGESRTPEFLAKNPNGRIPLLALPDGTYLAESNAMLGYLSEETMYGGRDRWERAQILQWLFFEQYSHEPYIATSRYWRTLLGQPEQYQDQLAQKQTPGYAALGVLETHLQQHPFLVSDRYTIADIALFAYTHVADEGGFSLVEFPQIRAWIGRVQNQPGHISIEVSDM
ncbi:MAG: glutathione S-transferase family protein [Spirulina sp. SIO3F2]|nr:glutathione S-transferase family protein [Spirulina sp. SIO3F2]